MNLCCRRGKWRASLLCERIAEALRSGSRQDFRPVRQQFTHSTVVGDAETLDEFRYQNSNAETLDEFHYQNSNAETLDEFRYDKRLTTTAFDTWDHPADNTPFASKTPTSAKSHPILFP